MGERRTMSISRCPVDANLHPRPGFDLAFFPALLKGIGSRGGGRLGV